MTTPSHLPRRRGNAAPTPRRVRPWLEQLESRALPSTLTVLNLNDSGAGSLRQAVLSASSGDTINFAVSGQITLTSGPVFINQDLNIIGPGASRLTVSGNSAGQVFEIGDVNVDLSGLTIANSVSGSSGGAIAMFADPSKTLSLSNCVFSNDQSFGNGGAVEITGDGAMNVTDCCFTNCSASLNGGAIDSPGVFLTVTGSTFSGNSAGNGGAISIGNDGVSIANSTFFGNSAQSEAGAIFSDFNANYSLVNCTVADNSAVAGGGFCIIGGSITLLNTIVAGNSASSGPDISGPVNSLGHNLIGETDGSSGYIGSDLTGTIASPLLARLGNFGNYGGLTPVVPLLQGSPALGDGSSSGAPVTDQRGDPRLTPVDIGAVQFLNAVVTNTSDSGPGSLRQAILDTNAHPGDDLITFAIPGAGVHVIQPSSTLPSITDTVTVDGYSQPGSSPNTLTNADNAAINIEINGQNQDMDGLNLSNVSGCVIDGLSIVGLHSGTSAGAGIMLAGGSSTGNAIWGNFLGAMPNGQTADADFDGILETGGAGGNSIGGATPSARNILSGNALFGFELRGNDNAVEGNFIGVGSDGQTALGNLVGGLIDAGGSNNVIGGTNAGQGNVIQDNVILGLQVDGTLGTTTGNAIECNSIFNNGSPGISLTNGGNNSATEPPPVLAYAFSTAGGTTVSGSLSSVANTTFRIEFFASPTKDPSGGQGKTFLGFTTVTTNGGGSATFTLSSLPVVSLGQFVSATATDAGNSTSQFAQDVLVTGQTSQLVLTGLPSVTAAGVSMNFTVKAEDSAGNVTPQYAGTVHFTSSDAKAVFPLNGVTLTNGVGNFSVTLKTVGTQSITATDSVLSRSGTLTVLPLVSLSVSGSTFAEKGGRVTVTATLNAISNQTVTIPLTFGGTAPSGGYTTSAAGITIAAGKTTGNITLTGANSPNFGALPQTVTVSLGSVTNALAGSPGAVSLTINPDPNAVFVTNCYQLLLNRAPDVAGFQYWLGLLNRGTSPSTVVRGIEASHEYLGDLVEGLYQHYLGRAADPTGLANCSAALAAGVSVEQVTANILASPEYLAKHHLTPAPGQSPYLGFVQGLYQQVLGRSGSPAEWATWTAALDGNRLTPKQAALSFLTSREYDTDLVNGGTFNYAPMWQGFYPEFLHEAAQPAILSGWVGALQNGMSDQAVLAGILGSPAGYADWS